MSIVNVKRLSHVALNVRDLESQLDFYVNLVGLAETARDDNGRVYLRCNADHHSLVLVPAQEAGLEAAARALEQAGIACETSDHGELGQGAWLRFTDPDGFTIELVGGMDQVDPNDGPRAVKPRRVAHITLLVSDAKMAAEFYREVLGFRVSDWFEEAFVSGSISGARIHPRNFCNSTTIQ